MHSAHVPQLRLEDMWQRRFVLFAVIEPVQAREHGIEQAAIRCIAQEFVFQIQGALILLEPLGGTTQQAGANALHLADE